jgi:hypothetical protein
VGVKSFFLRGLFQGLPPVESPTRAEHDPAGAFLPLSVSCHHTEQMLVSAARPRRSMRSCVNCNAPAEIWDAGIPLCQDPNFVQTNLVSNIPGLATITDPNLVNPWGVSHSPTSPFWVSNQGTNTATLYGVTDATNVSKVALTVAIPTTAAGPQGPTGQVNNANASSFPVKNGGDGGSAHFIFANLNGTISAWDKGSTAFIQVTTPGAVYTGLAINGAQTRLYAADDAGSGSVDVFDSSFAPLILSSSAFLEPSLPSGLVPFNVQDIGGNVYVTYEMNPDRMQCTFARSLQRIFSLAQRS